jgi:hypothetical protein
VFAIHLSDIGHMLLLQLFTRILAKLGRVGGAIQQHEEVLLGGWRSLVLRQRGVCGRDQAQQKKAAEENSSHTRNP